MAFQQGLSGLNSASIHLDVISRNIANSNTVGYKSGSTQFSDIFARSVSGATGGVEVGIGARVLAVAKEFNQGKLTSTENPLDMAINGEGFFKLNDGGSYVYSRNGQMRLDQDGYLVSNTDLRVRGYTSQVLDTFGNIEGFETEGDIKVDFNPIPASATDQVMIGLNLNANSALPVTTFPAAGPAPATGIPANSYNHSTTVAVLDSLGNRHDLNLYYVKTAANAWNMYATAENTAGTQIYDFGALTFDTSGNLTAPVSGSLPAVAVPIDVDSAGMDAEPLSITFLFNDGGTPIISQYASAFGVHQLDINGTGSGEFSSLSVSSDGTMTGVYSNGQTKKIAQLLLASFRDPQKLTSLGANQYQATDAAGPEIANKPGQGIAGQLQSGSVEDSNVDLTQELVNLIVAQRTYQANAQTVRTQSDLLQTLVNIS
jgi:flagellar hook protein FlgE